MKDIERWDAWGKCAAVGCAMFFNGAKIAALLTGFIRQRVLPINVRKNKGKRYTVTLKRYESALATDRYFPKPFLKPMKRGCSYGSDKVAQIKTLCGGDSFNLDRLLMRKHWPARRVVFGWCAGAMESIRKVALERRPAFW
ncbi:MAG: hypothetical protein JST78_01830 [Bacteroidetes bacterium]|nr:hypothetical protein [Bacteroidota bacterium]